MKCLHDCAWLSHPQSRCRRAPTRERECCRSWDEIKDVSLVRYLGTRSSENADDQNRMRSHDSDQGGHCTPDQFVSGVGQSRRARPDPPMRCASKVAGPAASWPLDCKPRRSVTEAPCRKRAPRNRENTVPARSILSRRSFLTTAGTAGVVAALDARDLMAQQPSADPPEMSGRDGAVRVALRINGKNHRLRIDQRARRCSIACARPSRSPEPRRAATTANAAHARCM